MTALLLRLILAVLLSVATLTAQTQPSTRIEVMVLGSMHLQQPDPSALPVNVAGVRHAVRAFAPGAVVIEPWLHSSIDPATTFNYPRLADRTTLGSRRVCASRAPAASGMMRPAQALTITTMAATRSLILWNIRATRAASLCE